MRGSELTQAKQSFFYTAWVRDTTPPRRRAVQDAPLVDSAVSPPGCDFLREDQFPAIATAIANPEVEHRHPG
jgi:hypothetical protein